MMKTSKNGGEVMEDIKFGCFGVGLYLKDGNKFETLKRAGPMNISLSFKFILFNEWIGRILYKGDAW
jgi:hypothetical protein